MVDVMSFADRILHIVFYNSVLCFVVYVGGNNGSFCVMNVIRTRSEFLEYAISVQIEAKNSDISC
jgi:hypothetical protein